MVFFRLSSFAAMFVLRSASLCMTPALHIKTGDYSLLYCDV